MLKKVDTCTHTLQTHMHNYMCRNTHTYMHRHTHRPVDTHTHFFPQAIASRFSCGVAARFHFHLTMIRNVFPGSLPSPELTQETTAGYGENRIVS